MRAYLRAIIEWALFILSLLFLFLMASNGQLLQPFLLLFRVLIALYDPVVFVMKALLIAFFYDDFVMLAPPIPDPCQLHAFSAFETAYRTGEPDALGADLNLKAFETALAANMAYWEAVHVSHQQTLARLQSPDWREVLWGYYEFTLVRLPRRDTLPFGVAMPATIDGLEEAIEGQAAHLATLERNQVQQGMQAIVDRVAAARASGDMSQLSGTTARRALRHAAFLYNETNAIIPPSRTRLRVLTTTRYGAWNKQRWAASRAYAAWWRGFRAGFNDTVAQCTAQLGVDAETARWSAILTTWTQYVVGALAPYLTGRVLEYAVFAAVMALMPLSSLVAIATSLRVFTIRARLRALLVHEKEKAAS